MEYDYSRLQKNMTRLQKEFTKLETIKEQVLEELKEDFGLSTLEQAKDKLEEMRTELEKQDRIFQKRLRLFERRYRKLLNNDFD